MSRRPHFTRRRPREQEAPSTEQEAARGAPRGGGREGGGEGGRDGDDGDDGDGGNHGGEGGDDDARDGTRRMVGREEVTVTYRTACAQ